MQYSWLLKVFFLVTLVEDDLVMFLFIHCEILLPSLQPFYYLDLTDRGLEIVPLQKWFMPLSLDWFFLLSINSTLGHKFYLFIQGPVSNKRSDRLKYNSQCCKRQKEQLVMYMYFVNGSGSGIEMTSKISLFVPNTSREHVEANTCVEVTNLVISFLVKT